MANKSRGSLKRQSTTETLMEQLMVTTECKTHFICKCPHHQDRDVELYCESHKQLCCDSCKSSNHQTCPDVKSVKELSRNITESSEFKSFNERIISINIETEKILNDAKEKLKLVKDNHDEIVDAVKEARKDLNEALDKIEKGMLTKAKIYKEKEATKVKAVSDKIGSTRTELSDLMKQLETLQERNRNGDIFVLMKEAENKLQTAEALLATLDGDIKVKGYMFLPNISLQDTLKKPEAMGKFFPNIWMEHASNIDLRSPTDTCNCWVTSMTTLSNKLITTDHGNYKIKAIDTDQRQLTVTSELHLQSPPWAITKISDQKVAVTVPYIKKIMIVKVDDYFLSTEKEIGTTHKCHGIAHWDGKFIVTYNKKDKIEILDLSGAVMHTITTDIIRQKLFSFPEYVTLSSNNQVVYVSNFLSDSVACIGLDGTIRGMYKDSKLIQPRSLVDRNGTIFICGFGSQNIHLITPDLRKIKVLAPTGPERLQTPRAICFSQEVDKLFIDKCPNFISVFNVSSCLNARTPKLNT